MKFSQKVSRLIKIQFDGLPDDVIYRNYTMRPGGSTVVDNCGVTLHPDPAAVFSQKAVVLRCNLTLHEY